MWSLDIGLRDSAAKARSMACPGLLVKSMVNRAKTVSTVLIRPNPQLRCMQKPLLVSCTKDSIWWRSNLPAAAIFSNSSLIRYLIARFPIREYSIKDCERSKSKRNCGPSITAAAGGRIRRKPAGFGLGTGAACPGGPRTMPGTGIWHRAVADDIGLADCSKNKGSGAKAAVAGLAAIGPLPDFLAGSDPQPRRRQRNGGIGQAKSLERTG